MKTVDFWHEAMRMLLVGMVVGALTAVGQAAPVRHASTPSSSTAPASIPFMCGAHIGRLTVFEKDGAVYRDHGKVVDPIEALRAHGVNWFRIRLLVHPSGEKMQVNTVAYDIAEAKRIKQAGGKVLLDIHYSDKPANPGHQSIPKAWRNLDFPQLVAKVKSYTASVIREMGEAGVEPDAVQIGNEINHGFLWPQGKLWVKGKSLDDQFGRFAKLLQAGIDGARQGVKPGHRLLIMIHLASANHWKATKTILSQLNKHGLHGYDIIGFSYYPRWHGPAAPIKKTLTNTILTFHKPVVMVETSFPYLGAKSEPRQYSYPMTKTGQKAFLTDMIQMVKQLPNHMGRGVFWWAAIMVPTKHHLAWNHARYSLFDQHGNLLPTVDAFAATSPQTKN